MYDEGIGITPVGAGLAVGLGVDGFGVDTGLGVADIAGVLVGTAVGFIVGNRVIVGSGVPVICGVKVACGVNMLMEGAGVGVSAESGEAVRKMPCVWDTVADGMQVDTTSEGTGLSYAAS